MLEIEPAPRVETIDLRQGPKLQFYDPTPLARCCRLAGGWRCARSRSHVHGGVPRSTVGRRERRGSAISVALPCALWLLWTEELQLHADLTEFDFVQAGRGRTVLEKRVACCGSPCPASQRTGRRSSRAISARARPAADNERKRWEGVAERIEQERVGLRFSNGLYSIYLGEQVDVWFVPRARACVSSTKAWG